MALYRIKKHTFERPVDKLRYHIIARRIADKLKEEKYPLGEWPTILFAASIISIMMVYKNDYSRDGGFI